jgi:hypothetical protein
MGRQRASDPLLMVEAESSFCRWSSSESHGGAPPRPRSRSPVADACVYLPLDLNAADPVDDPEAPDVGSRRRYQRSRVEAPRSSRSSEYPTAWGHLPIQGSCGDAAAARHRRVLLRVSDVVLQKGPMCNF